MRISITFILICLIFGGCHSTENDTPTFSVPEGVTYENYGRNEAVPLIMDKYLSQLPDLTLEDQVDWASLVGRPDLFSSYFPNEVVTPVLVKGWGPQATDEAVMIIARRSDGSLYWRGMFVAQGTFSISGY